MPVRRPLARSQNNKINRAVMETLESRQLLTSVINGFFPNGSNVLEYRDASDQVVRIVVRGNITAEFIGMRTTEAGFQTGKRFVDLVPFTAANAGEGVDLFHIYIQRGDPEGFISIARVPVPTATPRPMQPFTGDSGTIRVWGLAASELIAVSSGSDTGGVWIGARTLDTIQTTTNEQDIPILSHPLTRDFGVRPAPANGRLGAGISSAPGVNIGKILIGGTVTGNVNITGSIDTFYAGSILTGDATGQRSASGQPDVPGNFFVGGDIRNLYAMQGIGTTGVGDPTDPTWHSGFDLKVGGKLGEIRSAHNDVFGGIEVFNNTIGWRSNMPEQEVRGQPLSGSATYFQNGVIGAATTRAEFHNDSFDNPQYINSFNSNVIKRDNVAVIDGRIDSRNNVNDDNDYYAMALMAGQTVDVQLVSLGGLNVGVFDPDGRLIHTNYSRVNGANLPDVGELPFRFTADRPGTYRFAIGVFGDLTFTGTARQVVIPYTLIIGDAGILPLGAVRAAGTILTGQFGRGGHAITVRNGDMGSLVSNTLFALSRTPITVDNGNLRAVEAGTIGLNSDGNITRGPDLSVRRGSVGLLRASSPAGVLDINAGHIDFNTGLPRPEMAIGGDYQLVDSANILTADLIANRGMGVIRSRQIGVTTYSPTFVANADRRGNDGVIDLIAVTDDLGTLQFGGPAIITGPGGNVRYIRVGGTAFNDRLFGGGAGIETTYEPGETAFFTDDSGTTFSLAPTPQIGAGAPGQFVNPGRLRVMAYPIRGDFSGSVSGVAIIRATVEPGADGSGRGLRITSGARGTRGSVEIGEIRIFNSGTEIDYDPTLVSPFPNIPIGPGNPGQPRGFVSDPGGEPNDILASGPSTIDIFDIISRNPANTAFTGITSIVNDTDGEIVNVEARHIGGISAETIGLARSTTGTAVEGLTIKNDTYPFSQARNLIHVHGAADSSIPSLRARRGIGNILVEGIIGNVVADSNRRNVPGVHEGINAPIVALPGTDASNIHDARILSVDIGEGILPSGTGNVSFAGLYAGDRIGSIVGNNADIRGEVMAGANQGGPPLGPDARSIGSIRLTNGSIIDTSIMVSTEFDDGRALPTPIVLPDIFDTINDPFLNIGLIELNGNGGIIGSRIFAADVGPIHINNGFGFLNSQIRTVGDGVIAGIFTDGYGVRDSLLEGGASVGVVHARGDGRRLGINGFNDRARLADRYNFDPYSGRTPSVTSDLYAALGVAPGNTHPRGVANSGIIADSIFRGSRNLERVEAWQIQSRRLIYGLDFDTGREILFQPGHPDFPMQLVFGQHITRVITHSDVIGLAMQGGSVNTMRVGGNIERASIGSAGRFQNFTVNSTMRGTTLLTALGSEGQIDNITIGRGAFGRIQANVGIGTMRVGGNLGSPGVESSGFIRRLEVGQDILSGAFVRARNQLGTLIVGNDVQSGAVIRARSLGEPPQIGGDLNGQLIIG